MLIVGAGGHAREIADFIRASEPDLFFFDSLSTSCPSHIHPDCWVRDEDSAKRIFEIDPRFVVGVGGPANRFKLYEQFTALGGQAHTAIAPSSLVGSSGVSMGAGCNIMAFSFVSCHVSIGTGSLINARVNLHHDVCVGAFCEIGPAAVLLGKVRIGEHVFIGSGAIVLPNVEIGDGAVVGAGAVVTKNVAPFTRVIGVPAIEK